MSIIIMTDWAATEREYKRTVELISIRPLTNGMPSFNVCRTLRRGAGKD
jgi:hypothetical protein